MSDLQTDTSLTLERAFTAHQQWKARLQESVASGTPLDVALIRRDDCCELGKWLHSTGRSQYGGVPEFSKLVSKHASFQLVASVVANIINAREYDEAVSVLQDSSHFAIASTEVSMAIMSLKKVVSSAAAAG
jgi:methyl-accepting chemotaxis protein